MKDISHLPQSEQEHFMKCNGCEHYFDMRDLGQVFEHEHDDNLPKIGGSQYNSKRVGDSVECLKGKDPVNLN